MAKIHQALWLRFLLLTLLSSMASAQLPITDDSYISSGSSTLQGTNPSLAAQGPTASILIRPDISQLTLAGVSAGQVTKAYLKVYRTAVAVGGNIDVCEVSSTWAEKTVVYSSKPNLGTSLATVNVATSTAGQYLTLDITQAVKDWLNGATNNGIAIIPSNSCAWGSSGSTISMTLDSKESTTSSHAPEIDVVLAPSAAQLQGKIGPTQVDTTLGPYPISITGNAATATSATTAGSATTASSASVAGAFALTPSQCGATLFATGVQVNGNANCSGITNAHLPSSLVYNNQVNIFGAGFKQVFQSNSTAGLNIAAAVGNANPTSPAVGDLWFRLDLKHLHFNDGTTTHQLMYSDDTILGSQVIGNISGLQVTGNINGNAANVTGIVAVGNGGTGANTAATALTNLGAASATNLSNEVTRATGAETTLQTNVNNEVTARAAADTTLQTNINTEAATRATADVSLANSISFETTRATGAEGTLQTNINTLSAASAQLNGGNLFTGGKQNLAPSATGYASLNVPNSTTPPSTPGIGDVWLVDVNPHLNFRDMNGVTQMLAFTSDVTNATSAQTTALNNEIARATGAENTLTLGLAGEVTRATGAEMSLSTGLTSEVTRATGAEAALNLSKANLAGGNLFGGGSQTLAQSATSYPSLNIPVGGAAPSTLQKGDIWTLSTDPHLHFQDMTNATQMLAFTSDITTATNAQTTALNNEITRATGAESSLTTSLAGEVTRATGAEMSLSNSLTSEVTRATGAEAALNLSKANLAGGNLFTGGSQVLAGSAIGYPSLNIPNGSAAPNSAVTGDLWLLSGNSHLQFQSMSGLESLAFYSDITTATNAQTTALNNEITRATGAENTLTLSLAGEVTRATGAEMSLSNSLTSEVTRATGAEAALNTSKANLAGGNLFTGGSQTLAQSATSYPSLNIPVGGAAPSTLQKGDIWTLSTDPHLHFQDMTNATQMLAFTSDVTAANSSTLSSANSYTNTAVAAEATARSAADASEALARASGDATTLATANTYTDSSVLTETNRATAAEALKANLAGGNLFTGGSQKLAAAAALYPSLNVPNSTTAPSTPAIGDIWLLDQDPHLNFRDMNNVTQLLAFTSDVTAANSSTLSSANSYTDTKVATEASARSAADASEALARASGDATTLASANTYTGSAVSAEAVLRAAGDAAAVSSANAYTDGQVATINTSLAGKANLSGGNNFAGNQSITGNASITGNETLNGTLSLPAVSTISGTPASSHLLNLQGWDGTDATVFQWFVNNGGFLDLFTGTGGNSPTASGLKIGPDGKITFATGQTFPGTQSALTAGTGIGITGNTISNTGVTGLAGTLNQVNVSAGTGAVTLSLPSSVSIGGTMSAGSFSGNGSALTNLNASNLSSGTVPSGALAGSYGISITGSASTITGSIGGGQVNGNIAGNAANVTGTVAVANGGTGLTSGTSGGVLGFTAPGTLASSGALASGGVVLGGGAGATPSTSADFTTTSATNSAALKVGKSGTGTPNTGDLGALFLAGSTNGGPTLASQATGGSLTLQLPNTAPTANQVLTATAVNTNTVTLGFSTPSAGTVTTTGTPASGNLTKFSGTASVTNGDLSGDCTTTGTLSVTCTKTNGTTFAASATSDTTNAVNITGGTVSTARGGTGVSGAAVFPTSGTVATTTTVVGGDLGGTISSATVAKLQGNTVTLPTLGAGQTGQALVWNGTAWVNSAIATGVVPIIIGGNAGTKMGANQFMGLFSGNSTAAETDLELPVPRGGTISNFYVTQQGGTAVIVYTLRTGTPGGAMTNSTLTCTSAAVSGVTSCKDLTHSVVVSAGQTVTISGTGNPNTSVAWSAQLQ